MSNPRIVPFQPTSTHLRPRPRTFTSAEAMIDRLREEVLTSGKTYKDIAADCHVSPTTVHRLATGHTRWPRPTTLFPMLTALGLSLQIVKR